MLGYKVLVYKAWLETRIKLLLTLCTAAGFLMMFRWMGTKPPPPGAKPIAGLAVAATSFVVVIYTWFAGAGIVTQAPFQAVKGLSRSTQYTLSLPVSRLGLLAVRAGIGWLEMTGSIAAYCWGMWFVLPVIRGAVTAAEMFEYVVTLLACASAFYFFSVLLATFLDDIWRIWGGMLAFGALWGLSRLTPLPASVDIIRAMGDGSPLVAHTIPWSAMVFSLSLAAILFFTALRIARTREY